MTEIPAKSRIEPGDLFGNYKAEWLGERLFELFRQPSYFPDLERARPCVLIGSRGAGKTTVLRSLSYEGQYALNKNPNHIPNWQYFGFYYRVNTNRVTAFHGPELDERMWQKLFGHYLNLLLSQQVIKFLVWIGQKCPQQCGLLRSDCEDISAALNLKSSHSIEELQNAIKDSLIEFEATLNNIKSISNINVTMQGAPLDLIFRILKEQPFFEGKNFFFLIDEYENLLDYQQVAFNTLIKHASSDYTFKIGVRELGWRRRYTLNDEEELNSPADYVRVDIAERLDHGEFRNFAQQVCDSHLSAWLRDKPQKTVTELFPSLTPEEEALLLGGAKVAEPIRRKLSIVGNPRLADEAAKLSALELILISRRASQQGETIEQVALERRHSPKVWDNFVQNYRYATLFQIAENEASIRKYYCGWATYTTLASSNIRYLLELVDHAFREHARIDADPDEPFSFKTQTLAAQAVGKKTLFELEGYREGALLVKLVLGLGRVFGIMARQGSDHAPEQNEFSLKAQSAMSDETQKLITNAVMHSALVRNLGTKLNKGDARSYDYALHPIYSAFFGMSHRRKRKITIDPEDLMLLVTDSRKGLKVMLERQGRSLEFGPLPDQLRLFGDHIE